MEELNVVIKDVEKYIISVEDYKKYFNSDNTIRMSEYIAYLNSKQF